MANQLDDQSQTRLAMAALFAALAQALGESDKFFPSRFGSELEKLYLAMRDYPSGPLRAMETLKWTNELMRDPTWSPHGSS